LPGGTKRTHINFRFVSFLAEIWNDYLPITQALSPGISCLVPNYSFSDKVCNFKESIIVTSGLTAQGLCLECVSYTVGYPSLQY
jgi:hypothetical protein